MARKLIERGHNVTMVCGSYGVGKTGLTAKFSKGIRKGNVDKIEVIELELPYSNNDRFIRRTITFLKFAMRSIKIAMSEDYDLIFATSTPLTAGLPGIVAAFFRRKKFVFEVRDLWPELPRAMGVITNPIILSMMSILEWLSYHSAKYNIGLAPGIVQGIIDRNISKNDVYMIPNGCDIDLFSGDSNLWRPDTVTDEDFMAVFTGAHGIANGLNALLDVAIELKKRNANNIKLVLIGEGKLKKNLVARADMEGLTNCVFHDPVPKTKLSGLLRSADLGLMLLANVPAFYYGTSPNKFFDYIASGIPVLNNYPGWVADLIQEYSCGVVVPPDNPALFADALITMSNNKSANIKMGENSRKLALEKFDRQKLSASFVDVLEKAVL